MAVYFIRAGEDGPVKIGSAEDIAHRVMELQAGNAEPLILLREIVGGRQTEHFIHRHFKHQHIRGEWFRFDPTMLTLVPEIVERKPKPSGLAVYLTETATSKEAFAKRIGCTPEAVRLWCNGERQPRPKAVQAIQEATKGKVGWADFNPTEAAA